MATESILSATFGTPGSGKTYSRCKWLVDDFLINNPDGIYITNIPLNIEVISQYISDLRKVSSDDVAARLHIIPDDVLLQWEKLNQLDNSDLKTFNSSTFPPTVYFQQFNLGGAHIAIDEFHKFFGKKSPRALRALWNDWFAEIRKTGCVFEAITQSYGQMNDEFLDKCQTRLELVNHSDSKDPFFSVRMGDWYELKAGLFGHLPIQRVSERETMRGTSLSGKVVWKPTSKSKSYLLTPEYFRFYNSFRNYTGSSSERKSPSQIYKRRIWVWFLRRNLLNIFPRCLLAVLAVWFLLGGGFQLCLSSLVSSLGHVGKSNGAKIVSSENKSDLKKSSVVRDQKVNSDSSREKLDSSREKLDSGEGDTLSSEVSPSPAPDYDSFKPALFYSGMCFLRNGQEIYINYKFIGGVYENKIVQKIDSSKRCYYLDDGTCVYMY